MFLPLLFVILLAALAADGRAQNVDIRSITSAVNMAVTSGSFNLSTGAASVTSSSAISSQIRSRLRPWTLDVRALSSTFSHSPASGAPLTAKPVSDLLIRQNGTSAFAAISTSNMVVASGAATSSTNVNLDLRFDTSLSDSPGNYAATLVLTIITL
jgi:hypothetical protein